MFGIIKKDELQFLHLVQIGSQVGKSFFQSLPLLRFLTDLVGFAIGFSGQRIARHHLPMVEHALRERLSSSVGAKIGRETERLIDGQVGLHLEHGGTNHLGLLEHVTTTSIQHTIDAANCVFRALKEKQDGPLRRIQFLVSSVAMSS